MLSYCYSTFASSACSLEFGSLGVQEFRQQSQRTSYCTQLTSKLQRLKAAKTPKLLKHAKLDYCYSDFAKWRSEGSERTILLKAVGQGCSWGLLTCVNKAGLFMRLPAKCLTGCLFCRIFASQFRDNNFKKTNDYVDIWFGRFSGRESSSNGSGV